jgi:tetratricopeptide (TPR) repeat protein
MTRQVIELRKALVSEKDPQEWEALARALRSFYHREKIFPEALVLDQQLHARINNGVSATMLAETQLALNQNREAIKVLSALEPAKNNAATQALLGIARAREGQKEEARKIAEAYSLPEPAGLGLVYLAARLHAASGNADKALNLLKTTFEGVPPSRLETFKAVVKECPDFAGLAASSGFAQVLQTKSKVAESNCSGGTDCGSCPMRGKCPSSQGGNP